MPSGWPGASVETEVGPSLENVPLAAGSVREEAEWDQRVGGIGDYLIHGIADRPKEKKEINKDGQEWEEGPKYILISKTVVDIKAKTTDLKASKKIETSLSQQKKHPLFSNAKLNENAQRGEAIIKIEIIEKQEDTSSKDET